MIWLALLLLAASPAVEHYNRANELFQQQKFGEANEALEAALAADADYVPALTLRGKLAMAFNQFGIARTAFERAARLAPGSVYAQFMLGFFYYVDNDFTKAIPPLEAAQKLDPLDPRPVLYLAMSHEGLAKPEQAIPLYERAIELENNRRQPSPDTYTAYGRLLFTLGRYDDARQQFSRVLGIDPNSRDGHYELGRLDFEKGRHDEAVVHGEKALAVKGMGTTDRQIHFLLARAYSRLGKRHLADDHLYKFQAAAPTLRR